MNVAINLISNGDKLSIQFPKLGKKLLKQNQSGSSNLVLLDHQLLKNNCTLGIEKMNSKEIYSIIISSKVNIPTSRTYFEKNFFCIIFNGKIYTHFRLKPLQMPI